MRGEARSVGNKINCLTAKEWMKNQLGVWEFYYEKRDVRDKTVHPATFPISMARQVIELFTHEGELVLDPFVGSGTTLVACQDTNRNAVGFDLQKKYVDLCKSRLSNEKLFNNSKQLAVVADARNISQHLKSQSVKLIWTSPPYANLLNRERKNKSRRDRDNGQLGKVEQYSQDERNLGTLELGTYSKQMGDIYESLLSVLRDDGHCVINVPDMWWENKRIIAGHHWWPKTEMLKFIAHDPERVREMFRTLGNEEADTYARIDKFIGGCDRLKAEIPGSKNHFHKDKRMVSVFLTFCYPEKYSIYKFKEYKDFMKMMSASYIPGSEDIIRYYNTAKFLHNFIAEDKEILFIHEKLKTNDCYKGTTIMHGQDFIWCCTNYNIEKY